MQNIFPFLAKNHAALSLLSLRTLGETLQELELHKGL